MRPVNKGSSPYTDIREYGEALPYLRDRIGLYCSYCEFPIQHVPEVEHKISKTKGGSWTAWSNLLLGCKYCNTRKSNHTVVIDQTEYLWPDENNTAIAFTYQNGMPKVNAEALTQINPDGTLKRKAENLFRLVQLDHIPTPKEKDRRFRERNEAYQMATCSLENWKSVKESPASAAMLSQILMVAKEKGFFSVWMTVFHEEPEVLRALIPAFPGTNEKCFDENGHPVLNNAAVDR